MSADKLNIPPTKEIKGRPLGSTEQCYTRAVPGGTGVAVLAILRTIVPDISILKNVLHNLHISHPVLRAKLHAKSNYTKFSFTIPSTPCIQIKQYDLSSTLKIIENLSDTAKSHKVSPFHMILEHEINQDSCFENIPPTGKDVFHASVYALPDTKWAVVFRVHGTACDRTTAVTLLRKSLTLTRDEEEGGMQKTVCKEGEFWPGVEDLVPSGRGKRNLLGRGVDMLSYSLNALRTTNLKFIDTRSPRKSEAVRLKLNTDETAKLLAGCKLREIKLCGALSAAALIAAHSSKDYQKAQQKKYAVVTLTDLRSSLEPELSSNDFGFYHSAVHNIHPMKGGEKFWDMAQKTYKTFLESKTSDKHFTDMSVHNFLMCRVMDSPSLTPSSSMRISYITVFEDTVTDDSKDMRQEVGVEDFVGCSSIHGVGPSIAMFDIIQDGCLDCVCVYPSPLHTREQIHNLVDAMKAILVGASNQN